MHFFIEQNNLNVQSVNEQFGAVHGFDIENKYRTTACFNLTTSAKAYATIKSQLIIQQSSHSDLVNIVLKPITNTKIHFPAVRYFIYRGIDKNSFIKTGSVDEIVSPTNSNASTLIQQFWTKYNNWKNKLTTTPVIPKIDVFGYDSNTINDTELLESIFQNRHSVRSLVVKEGTWIGNFSSLGTIGLDIVLFDGNFQPTLGYVRQEEHILDVDTKTGFKEKKFREQVLSFIDPAAFYGLHVKKGVGVDGNINKLKDVDLYDELISKFNTKNKVYIDIRNEEGYSYNFYDNYQDTNGFHLKVGNHTTATSLKKYDTHKWPIHVVDLPIGATNANNDIDIQFYTADNSAPLLYYSDIVTTRKSDYGQFVDQTQLYNGTDWSDILTLNVPNKLDGGIANNIASYLKLDYYRKQPYDGLIKKIPKSNKYHTNIFGPINHPQINTQNHPSNEVDLGHRKLSLGYLPDSGNFIQQVNRHVIWDNSVIIFQAVEQESFLNSGNILDTFRPKREVTLDKKITNFLMATTQFSIITIEEDNQSVNLLQMVSNGRFIKLKESLMLLGITQSEFNTLKSYTGLETDIERFINLKPILFVENNPVFKDINEQTYYKYKLIVQGYDSDGNFTDATQIGNPIIVYSVDGLGFFSKDFLAGVWVKPLLPKIEGPYDENGKLVKYVSRNHAYAYRTSILPTPTAQQVLKVKWAVSYDNKLAKDSFYLFAGGRILNQKIEVDIQSELAKDKFKIYAYTGRMPTNQIQVEVPYKKVVVFFVGGAGDHKKFLGLGPTNLINDLVKTKFDEIIEDENLLNDCQTEYLGFDDLYGEENIMNNVIAKIPNKEGTSIYIVGHSLGGWNSAHLTSKLYDKGYNVDLLITLDPVGLKIGVQLVADIYGYYPVVKCNYWINIYSDADTFDSGGDFIADFGGQWIPTSGSYGNIPHVYKEVDYHHDYVRSMFFNNIVNNISCADTLFFMLKNYLDSK